MKGSDFINKKNNINLSKTSGKGHMMKMKEVRNMNDNVIIIDPEKEYEQLSKHILEQPLVMEKDINPFELFGCLKEENGEFK